MLPKIYAKSSVAIVFALFVCASLSGCATIANLNGSPTTLMQIPGIEEPEYFGGVKRYSDAKFGLAGIGDGGLIVITDTPLTIVGDIVTLPIVHHLKKNSAKTNQSSNSNSSE